VHLGMCVGSHAYPQLMARDWEAWLATASGPASPTEEQERDRTEALLGGDVADNLGDIGRLLPGAAALAVSGKDPGTLLAPAVGLVLLAFYAAVAALAGASALSRRDVS
jgi:hypothetical protein